MDLTAISNIWKIIVESNIFNFVIFILAFAWIFKKINVKGIIHSLQAKIVKVLDEVKQEKEEALEKLAQAEKAVENLSEELQIIVDDAQKSAGVISEKILTEAQKQIESIELNATKVIEAEEKLLVSQLTKSTSQASVEVAKSHIEQTLAQTPSLHEKFINESIDELDRLNF